MDSKKIVVYYSYTGHTRKIAQKISKKLNCDIVEIKPVEPYSTDYQTVVDEEQNKEAAANYRKIEKVDVDFSKYDVVIVGFPTWWYIPASPMRTFLRDYDLSKKVVVPFATNAGWLGKSFNEVEKLCKNSKVENEMNIVFGSYSDELVTEEKKIDEWIDSI